MPRRGGNRWDWPDSHATCRWQPGIRVNREECNWPAGFCAANVSHRPGRAQQGSAAGPGRLSRRTCLV